MSDAQNQELKIFADKERWRALERSLTVDAGAALEEQNLAYIGTIFSQQSYDWLRSLQKSPVKPCEIAEIYDDTLAQIAPPALAKFLQPTDLRPPAWIAPFTPMKTALPPGSDDSREGRAFFIASHEHTHFLYQWQALKGWRHIPIQGDTLFCTLEKKQYTDATFLKNYLEGIPWAEHAVHYADSVYFPFSENTCANKIQIPPTQQCRILGQAVSFDLGWRYLTIQSPQQDGTLKTRRIAQWGLHHIFRHRFPHFSRLCPKLLKIFTSGQPHIPEFQEEELAPGALWKAVQEMVETILAVGANVDCHVFFDGWFNSHLLQQCMIHDLPSTFHMGAKNIFTPWHRTLCPEKLDIHIASRLQNTIAHS